MLFQRLVPGTFPASAILQYGLKGAFNQQLASKQSHTSSTHSLKAPYSIQSTYSSEESVAARTPPISNIVRLLMRRVPHAVVVITSLNEKPPNLYCGMTISSFNTLTLSPYPVVSFNIKRPSSTYDAIKFSKEFLVHVLAANAAGAEIAQAFAKQHPAHTSIFPPQFWRLEYDASRKEQRLRDGIMDVLKCHLMPQEIELGDHAVVLGKVSEVQNYGNELRGDVALSYLDGKYRIAEEY